MVLIKSLLRISFFIFTITMLIPIQAKAVLPRAEVLLQKMVQADNSLDFEGRLTLMLQSQMGNQAFEIYVTRKAPDKRRIEIISPSELYGTGFIINGNENMPIRPGNNPRFLPPPPFLQPDQMEDAQIHNIQILLKNYKVRALDGGSVAGRSTYLIEIDPKNINRPSSKIWIDKEKSITLKTEQYNAKKMLQRVVAYSTINFEPVINNTIFQMPRKFWDIRRPFRQSDREEIWNYAQGKPDLDKIRDKIHFEITLPDRVSGGFALHSINIVKIGREPNIHLKYTDGLTILSVFQSPSNEMGKRRNEPPPPPPSKQQPPPSPKDRNEKISINGVKCEVLSRSPVLIFRWQNKGIYFTIIGELQKKEMINIAGSFIPKEAHIK
jgi:outer membrane lipoprotein-sorting protein